MVASYFVASKILAVGRTAALVSVASSWKAFRPSCEAMCLDLYSPLPIVVASDAVGFGVAGGFVALWAGFAGPPPAGGVASRYSVSRNRRDLVAFDPFCCLLFEGKLVGLGQLTGRTNARFSYDYERLRTRRPLFLRDDATNPYLFKFCCPHSIVTLFCHR